MSASKGNSGFWRKCVGAGLALGVAFASGFVVLNGKQMHTVTMQKQKNIEKVKPSFIIGNAPVVESEEA
ncbi:MAG TPA: hypothetical protein VLA25_03065 [Methylotenera sp.]|nr:hypothetical protein [Methylotenera sp.]